MNATRQETDSKPHLITAWTRAAEQVFEGLTKVKPGLQWKLQEAADDVSLAVKWWEARYEGGDQRAWIGVATPAALELNRLADAVSGSSETQAESPGVESTIESLCSIFAEFLSRETGKTLTWKSLDRLAEPPRPSVVYTTEITLQEGSVLSLLVGFNAELRDGFEQPPSQRRPVTPAQGAGFGALFDLELPLRVRFGRTQMALERVLQLQVGSVLELEGTSEDPVDLLVNGSLVARGEVVAIEGYYGVRILEVTGKDPRAAASR
jgi:flagellar motor switch protein FliN